VQASITVLISNATAVLPGFSSSIQAYSVASISSDMSAFYHAAAGQGLLLLLLVLPFWLFLLICGL
jgi:hypothetical protein